MTDSVAARALFQAAAPANSAYPGSEEGFRPVQGVEKEQVSAASTVVQAYVIILVIWVAFLFLTVRKLKALSASADRLEAALRKH